jgi:hypothetical protein
VNGGGKSTLRVEWTAQHGCGGSDASDPSNVNCDLIIQYMCRPQLAANKPSESDRIRDGLSTQRQKFTEATAPAPTVAEDLARKQADVSAELGLHESWDSYDECITRERNSNLFVADQKLNNNQRGYSSAVFTRQESRGARRGYECPEERDYYPYWHPSAWKDIAVLTNNQSKCAVYQSESFNVKPRHRCVETDKNGQMRRTSRWNNHADCSKNGGTWTEFYNYLEKASSKFMAK